MIEVEIQATVDPVRNAVDFVRTDGNPTLLQDFDHEGMRRAVHQASPFWPGEPKLLWFPLLDPPWRER